MSEQAWQSIEDRTLELFNLENALPVRRNAHHYIQTLREAQDPSIDGNTVIDEDTWIDYNPPGALIKNTTRYLQFEEHIPISSPFAPKGTIHYVSTNDQPDNPDGFTWAVMSYAQSAMWPFIAEDYSGLSMLGPFQAGLLTTTPPAGSLKVSNNLKCQALNFWATHNNQPDGTPLLRFKIFDQHGNGYIMHTAAVEAETDIERAFDEAVLPAGWRKEKGYLSDNLKLFPSQAEAGEHGICNYNLVRDSADNAYHQFQWADNGITVNAQVAGMDIWGSRNNDYLTGDHAGVYGSKDVIYGAQGNDTLVGGLESDQLMGDAGEDLLIGGTGDDLLHGGTGNDRLRGGQGADQFIVAPGEDSIEDFNPDENDTIHIASGLGFDLVQVGSDVLIQHSAGVVTAIDASIHELRQAIVMT